MDALKISLICLLSVAFCLSLVIFFVLIMFHSDMRVINRKRFNNFNERRTIGVDSEVFLTFEEFMNYYSLAPGKYVGEVETFDEKLKKQKETAEFLNYVQDARDNRKKWCEVFNKDEKFFENEF